MYCITILIIIITSTSNTSNYYSVPFWFIGTPNNESKTHTPYNDNHILSNDITSFAVYNISPGVLPTIGTIRTRKML